MGNNLSENKKGHKKNKRKYQFITPEEERLLNKNGITKERFYGRITSGWSRSRALNEPVIQYQKISKEERALMNKNGIDSHTFRSRISRNMNRKEAATRPKRKYRYKDK